MWHQRTSSGNSVSVSSPTVPSMWGERKTARNGVTRSLMPCTYPLAGCLQSQQRSPQPSPAYILHTSLSIHFQVQVECCGRAKMGQGTGTVSDLWHPDQSRSGWAVWQYLMPQRYRMRSRLFCSCLWAKKGTPGAVLGTSTITCASQRQLILA